MKLMTLMGGGLITVVLGTPLAMAQDREQDGIMEQKRQRLEQRFQNRVEGAGIQYRHEYRLRQRSVGSNGQQYRYEEQKQQRSSDNGGRY